MEEHELGNEFNPIPLPDYRKLDEKRMRRSALEFYELMTRRHSVRQFSPRSVPRDIIETCILAAGTAPSGANHQPWHFVVVGDSERKKLIRKLAEEEESAFYAGRAGEEWLKALRPLGTDPSKAFLESAPWLICIFGESKSVGSNGSIYKNYYVPESVSIATGILIVALHNAGLATLTHTPAPMGFLNKICQRPKNNKPYVLLVTGYPSSDAVIPEYATVKKPLDKITTFF